MPSSRNPLARLGLALTAAVLGLGVATAAAVADPTETTSPPVETTETTPTAEPTEESTEPATTEPTEPSTQPSTSDPTLTPTEEPEPGPAKEEPAVASILDVQMTTVFDKPSYDTGEQMTIKVTVRNAGADPVDVRVDFVPFGADAILVDYPNPFDGGNLFTLAAGAERTHTITGATGNANITSAKLHGWVSAPNGQTRAFSFATPIEQTTGRVAGTVYTDRNDNGRFDAGEGQGGITLTWVSWWQHGPTLTTTTNATGGFSLNLPTGRYSMSGTGPDGLRVGYQQLTIDESGMDDLLLRAVGPLSGLTVDMEFTKETYARDEAPVVRVTLVNSGDRTLHGIVANCNRGGSSHELAGTGPGWGALADDGLTLAPHSTTVLEVTEPMPEFAYEYGDVFVLCDFGYEGVDELSNPSDFDRALVPGQRGDVEGSIRAEGTGIAGVRVVLVLQDGACPVAETVSDAAGRFAFKLVPVGIYDVYLFTPTGWRVTYENPTSMQVIGHGTASLYLEVEQGTAVPPTLPNCPSGTPAPANPAPVAQARPAPKPALAYTGASIAAPAIVGGLALLVGTGAVVATRRRKPADEN
ncbi:hypothetical protein [Actinophytocola sp.]|uniref:hypothetical protein n=1 Tax=Actinophytocola sp. TaxID=1872138 RepID=UPI002ED24072